jgi:leader peptidase (prepilin peptidase) / N-methyltransferase
MTAILLVASVVYGLAIGSFLNVVIYRVPLKKSILRPPSACPGCGAAIKPYDNIPVISWLVLRGKCRACRDPISVRYPLVEALTAALFVVVALRFGWSWTLPGELFFVAGLVALAFTDLDHLLLPKAIVYPVAGLVGASLLVAAAVHGSWHRLLIALLCGAVEFALLFTIHFVSPRSMGFGDVRFGPLIAFALGWIGWRYAFWGFLLANASGAVVGLALIAAGRTGRKTPIPFGVFLSLGAILAIAFAGAIHYPPSR